jgi:hypothetical protein
MEHVIERAKNEPAPTEPLRAHNDNEAEAWLRGYADAHAERLPSMTRPGAPGARLHPWVKPMSNKTEVTMRAIPHPAVEGSCSHMPTYHHKKDWRGRGRLTIIPKPWYRALPVVGPLFVWRVGDKVRFDLHIGRPNEPTYQSDYQYVFEKFAGENWVELDNIAGKDTQVEGHIIPHEGDVEYGVGALPEHGRPETIITMKAEDWDSIWSKLWWVLVGVFLSVLGGVLLRIIGR